MGWLDEVRYYLVEKLNPAQPSIAASEGTAITGDNIADFEKAYRDIDIVNRAIDMIVNACVSIPFEVTSPNNRGAVQRVANIINEYSNPYEDRVRLFRRAFLDYLLGGNAFFYYDKESRHIYVLPANQVTIVPDERTFVKEYTYVVLVMDTGSSYGYRRKPRESKISFTPDEIIHIRADSEESIYRGRGKLTSVKRLIELYYSLNDFQKQFFQNNAIPGIVLTTDNVLSKPVKDRLLDHWRTAYNTLFKGARSPAILDGGLKIDKLGDTNFKELDFEGSVSRIQQDIAKALGVPYTLLMSGNNANLDANQKLFYSHTILPILDLFSSAFQRFFGPGIKIIPDVMKVSVLQPDQKTQSTYVSTLVNTGIISPNEAREALGWEKLTDEKMNEIRVPQNITGSATNPSLGGRPVENPTTTSTEETT